MVAKFVRGVSKSITSGMVIHSLKCFADVCGGIVTTTAS